MARHAAQPTLAGSGVCLLLQVLFTFENHVCILPSPYSLSLSQGEERVSDAPERERERERERGISCGIPSRNQILTGELLCVRVLCMQALVHNKTLSE